MPTRRPRYSFDRLTARYRHRVTGRFVNAAAVRAEIDRILDYEARNIQTITAQFREGKIPLSTWEAGMRESVKNTHLYSAAAAKGGWAQLSPSDLGTVGARVKEQYRFLGKFAQQISDERIPIDGRVTQRAQLYALAGRSTHEHVRSIEFAVRGYDQIRSILQPADHCIGDRSCVAESLKGWQPVGAMIPIGERLCGHRCRCTVERRNSLTGQIAA